MPYVVVGTGGVGVQAVPTATKKRVGDVSFDSSCKGYGYLTRTVTATKVVATLNEVNESTDAVTRLETATLDLATMTVSTT